MESRKTVLELAEETLQKIEKDQWYFTSTVRVEAKNRFKKLVEDKVDAKQLLGEARLLIQINHMSGEFGKYGEENSTFMKHMRAFVDEGQKLADEEKQLDLDTKFEVVRQRAIADYEKSLEDLRLAEEARQKEKQAKLQQEQQAHTDEMERVDAKRKQMEQDIAGLFKKHHHNDKLRTYWNSYVRAVNEHGETPHFHNVSEMRYLKDGLKHDVHDKLLTYRKLINTTGYSKFFEDRRKTEELAQHNTRFQADHCRK